MAKDNKNRNSWEDNRDIYEQNNDHLNRQKENLQGGEKRSYQPTTNELDDDNPPRDDD